MHPAHQPRPASMPPACRAAEDPEDQSPNVTLTAVPLITHRHMLAAPFGAIVRGLAFSDDTSPETVAEVEQAIGQYQVLVFRGHKPPTDAQLAEFTGHFGVRNVKTSRQMEFTRKGFPEIVLISNVIENGKPIGTIGNQPLHWHADLAHSHQNVRFGFLDAVEVPEEGGETIFASGYAALEALSPAERERIADLEVYHVGPRAEYPKPGRLLRQTRRRR